MIALPPLALYIHIPWCVRKCPYCDFNSHAVKDELDEAAYVDALLKDLDWENARMDSRPVESIFIGGGTPSLFSGEAIATLLRGVRARVALATDAEITLEANPGTAEAGRFAAYRRAGVNRLSLGVQSLNAGMLQALGRIHGPEEARAAVYMAREAGFDNLNIDLMFGLPEQTPAQARIDLNAAIALEPEHLSYYQLTLEPNTAFAASPPPLPTDDRSYEMQQQGIERLVQAGYAQYEVSAYARDGRRCQHNLNYWCFGDYIGIGAGAHGKTTVPGGMERRWKQRHPMAYLRGVGGEDALAGVRELNDEDLIVEFMMNALRLTLGFPLSLFEQRTRLPRSCIEPGLKLATERRLITTDWEPRIRPTAMGRAFLNDLVSLFL